VAADAVAAAVPAPPKQVSTWGHLRCGGALGRRYQVLPLPLLLLPPPRQESRRGGLGGVWSGRRGEMFRLRQLLIPPLRQACSWGGLGPGDGGRGNWVQGASSVGVVSRPQDALPQLRCGARQASFGGLPPVEEGLVIPEGDPLRIEADSLHQCAHLLLILEGTKPDPWRASTHLGWVGGSGQEMEGEGPVVRDMYEHIQNIDISFYMIAMKLRVQQVLPDFVEQREAVSGSM